MPISSFLLSTIRIDGGTQVRQTQDLDTPQEWAALIEDGIELPPVVVFFDSRHYWLTDGFGRFEAHRLAKRRHILAEVREGTLRDAKLYALEANTRHGRPLTSADRRAAVLSILADAEWSSWSDAEIARRCGVSRRTVGRLRLSRGGQMPTNLTNLDTPELAQAINALPQAAQLALIQRAEDEALRQREAEQAREAVAPEADSLKVLSLRVEPTVIERLRALAERWKTDLAGVIVRLVEAA